MKKNDLTKGLVAALLLASPMAGAGPYPPPFEPTIIYQDADYIAKQGQSKPAPGASEQAKPAAAGTKYPADFEPVILYQDAEAIARHSQSKTAAASTEQARPAAALTPGATAYSAPGNPLLENYPVGVVVLALAGWAFWNIKRAGSEVQPMPSEASGFLGGTTAEIGTAGETGVARYLKNLPVVTIAPESGVTKYLKNLPVPAVVAAAETGVAKYLKNVPASPKVTAGETGVAKYLKTLGA